MPNSLRHTSKMFGMISIWLWPGLYTRTNTESYKDLGDKNRAQESQYFTVLTGQIFYGIDQSMRH